MKCSRKKKGARRRNGGSAITAGRPTRWTPVPSNSPFIDETLAFWQPSTRRQLTREDAREIIENVAGFFSVLQEWSASERLSTDAANPSLDAYRTTAKFNDEKSSAS